MYVQAPFSLGSSYLSWSLLRKCWLGANLGGVYMTPGQLSRQDEFTLVPSHSSTFVYIIPPQNVMPARVAPA